MLIRGLHVERAGDPAGAPVLFLHAALGSARMWSPVWNHLQNYALSGPDLPGHGRTRYDEGRDFQTQALEDALSCVERGPVHLVGHSFGATVALRMALEHPGKVRSLTLIEPVYFVLLHDAGEPMFKRHLREMSDFDAAFETDDMETAARIFLDMWGERPFEALPKAKQKEMAGMMPLIRATEPAILKPETKERVRLDDLEQLACPLQLIMGGETQPVIRRIQRVIIGKVPDAKAGQIGEAGHMVPLTHPGKVALRLRSFWKEHSARG